MTHRFSDPPRPRTAEGALRRVGVEIEYAKLDVQQSADLVQSLFGGQQHPDGLHRIAVKGSDHGDFLVELDLRLLHREVRDDKPDDDEVQRMLNDLDRELTKAAGDVAGLLVPCEIACPPIAYNELGAIEELIVRLREKGAIGTSSSLLAAFGLQLNVELASLETDDILRQIRAYLLTSDWLREEIGVNIKRRLATFIDPFPARYVEKVVDPGYKPDLGRLIDDYIEANPTRYKEFDLLPLFAHLDKERVRAQLPKAKINPRPTFHYRLPDSRVDDPSWSLAEEWDRWLVVERVAADKSILSRLQHAYLEYRSHLVPLGWAERTRRILRSL